MTRLVIPATIPEADRMGRICELLSKAMILAQAQRVVANEMPPDEMDEGRNAGWSSNYTSDDSRLEAYIAMMGEASPAQIRVTLEWSRKRTYLVVHRLQLGGRIVAIGQTRSLVYRLSPAVAAKAELN